MPSLKDLRNRIASVKATQKITKAMQMVAAAKLRRAQSAAEAARPFAERMARGARQPRRRRHVGPETPRLLAGTGADQTHLLVVCTAERGLCGAFNSSIARLAREHANRLIGRGQDGQDRLRRQEGLRHPAPAVRRPDHRLRRPARRAPARLRARRGDRGEGDARCSTTAQFDVATLFYSRFKSVISQIPTAQQIIPAEIAGGERRGGAGGDAVYDYEPGEGEILEALLPRNAHVQIFRALLENAASEQGARMSRHGQRHPQRRRHDQAPDADLQPHAPGADHQGADRDHLGRRGALRHSDAAGSVSCMAHGARASNQKRLGRLGRSNCARSACENHFDIDLDTAVFRGLIQAQ